MVKMLRENGAAITYFGLPNELGISSLALASRHERYATMLYLLRSGYNPTMVDEHGHTILHYFYQKEKPKNLKMYGLLTLYDLDINKADGETEERTPGHFAFMKGNMTLMLLAKASLQHSKISKTFVEDSAVILLIGSRLFINGSTFI